MALLGLAGRAAALLSLVLSLILVPGRDFASGPRAEHSPDGLATHSLDGDWEFRQSGHDDWLPARVPGCVHLDLMRAGRIPDPFDQDLEKEVQWVEEAGWQYRKTVHLPASLIERSRIELVCLGLDTFARISVNGTLLASTDNMFRTWRFEVKPFLRPGDNEFVVDFDSPAARERSLEGGLSYKLPGQAPHIRKAPYQFGWDWAPRLATSGIWRSLRLEAWDGLRLDGLRVVQESVTAERASLRVEAAILAEKSLNVEAELTVVGRNGRRLNRRLDLSRGLSRAEFRLDIERPDLWWPAGMGGQPLYTVRMDLRQNHRLLDRCSLRTGLRTLELVQEPDAWGTSFRFEANGVPFFAKGANWVPADSFPSRLTRERYVRLLRDCRAANMNMVRVWGGGVYEAPEFYDLCDELGLVVWQDFMFACALYPGHDDFLRNVSAEATDVVRRLRHHPSLALWCGNNECEEGWFHWGWREALPAAVWEDYQKIFHQLLPEVVEREDPGRAYWPSSPHSLRPGHPRAEDSGDMHYWGVWHGREPFERYRKARHRFMSEFGFQSFPAPETIRSFARPQDLRIDSPVMESHQKHPRGNALILEYLLDRFRPPKDFESLVWLSQVLQAEAMKTAVEHFRSQRPRVMGALYWQLNDCWPVASWSGLDYFGRWKALHYYARRFFAPCLLAPVEADGRLDVYLVSDLLKACELEFRWSLEAYDGPRLSEESLKVRVEPGDSRIILSRAVSELKAGRRDDEVYLVCEVKDGQKTVGANIHHFCPLKNIAMPDPGLIFRTARDPAGGLVVVLEARRLAKNVSLEAPGLEGRFEDSFFDLVPGQVKSVAFLGPDTLDPEGLGRALRVRTLRDTY